MSTYNKLHHDIYNSRGDAFYLSEFSVDDLFTESSEGKIGKLQLYVYTGEGTIPHFHLFEKDHKFETCVCIDKPEYFHHGRKSGVLNSKQKELLIRELSKEVELDDGITCSLWRKIKIIWNSDTRNKFKSVAKKMPDYTEL